MLTQEDNIQARIERSIQERIRICLVEDGYLPDVKYFSKDIEGQAKWDIALNEIYKEKSFAVEVFGHSAEKTKGLKKTPRIVVIPRRMMPGDIGTMGSFGYQKLPDDPDIWKNTLTDYHSTTMYLDINIVSANAEQDRYLNYILNRAVGVRRFIPLFDSPEESFLIEQFNYYDLPDNQESIEEKAYSYRIPDIWMYEEFIDSNALINEIKVDITEAETIKEATNE